MYFSRAISAEFPCHPEIVGINHERCFRCSYFTNVFCRRCSLPVSALSSAPLTLLTELPPHWLVDLIRLHFARPRVFSRCHPYLPFAIGSAANATSASGPAGVFDIKRWVWEQTTAALISPGVIPIPQTYLFF